MSTGLYCTHCGDEFGLDDTVILKDTGFVSLTGLGGAIVMANDSPYIEQLCEDCGELLQVKEQQPNRVVIATHRFNACIEEVRAVRPNDVVVIIKSLAGCPDKVWGRREIKQLCTIKEEA